MSLALATAALILNATARADMQIGNYRLDTPAIRATAGPLRFDRADMTRTGMPDGQAIAQPNGQAAFWKSDAHLANGRYTMADGVRCAVQFFPSHDVYTWDAATLAGQVDSTFDTGCSGGPGSTNSSQFWLVRW
ncbi:hypothetical protein MOTT12_00821 [Mycobacterium intracellulare subsp. yongonense]|nr:hypothetical protein MOTT12_00821 [Mycobacterium intracellulare subsp. yongonense]